MEIIWQFCFSIFIIFKIKTLTECEILLEDWKIWYLGNNNTADFRPNSASCLQQNNLPNLEHPSCMCFVARIDTVRNWLGLWYWQPLLSLVVKFWPQKAEKDLSLLTRCCKRVNCNFEGQQLICRDKRLFFHPEEMLLIPGRDSLWWWKRTEDNCRLSAKMSFHLGVERNRKQELGSFQELLDFVPATFSPSRSAGPLFVLTSCFKYNAT